MDFADMGIDRCITVLLCWISVAYLVSIVAVSCGGAIVSVYNKWVLEQPWALREQRSMQIRTGFLLRG